MDEYLSENLMDVDFDSLSTESYSEVTEQYINNLESSIATYIIKIEAKIKKISNLENVKTELESWFNQYKNDKRSYEEYHYYKNLHESRWTHLTALKNLLESYKIPLDGTSLKRKNEEYPNQLKMKNY